MKWKANKKHEKLVRQDKDYFWYSAGGTRGIIIESEEPESRDVVHRKLGILNSDDKQKTYMQ